MQPYQPYFNTSTVPQARINALANVLAYCVEDTTASESQCGTLFSNANPTGGTKPVDTLQAALNIALNPGSNGISPATLLASMVSAYTPSLNATTAPTDLTLALTFTGGGLGIEPGGYATGARQVANLSLAADMSGNIWVGNSYMTGTASNPSAGYGALALFTNQGVPLTTKTFIVSNYSYGGFQLQKGKAMSSLAFDQSGTLWAFLGNKTYGLLPMSLTTCSGSTCLSAGTAVTATASNAPFTIDALGNLWGANANGTTGISLVGYDPTNSTVVLSNGSSDSNPDERIRKHDLRQQWGTMGIRD